MTKRVLLLVALLLGPIAASAQVLNGNAVQFTNDSTRMTSGAGSPEGSVVGAPGDVYISTNGSVYTKGAGTGTDNSGWTAIGSSGTGTVTNVGLTMPGIFSVSGSPVTTAGTIAASLATQSANRVWAGPVSGSAAQPAFRQIVFGDLASNGCTTGQIPKYDGAAWVCDDDAGASSGAPNAAQYVTLATDGTLTNERVLTAGTGITLTDAGAGSTLTVAADGANIGSLSAANISAGTLAVARGGTNLTAASDDNVMVGNGTTWQSKAIGDCDDTGGNHLNYDTGTNAFSCGTSSSGGGGSGAVVQVVNTQTGAVATGTTAIPFDDTIPQNTEGDEYMTLAVTPTDAANTLRIDVVLYGSVGTGNRWALAALFQDSTASALAAGGAFNVVATAFVPIVFTHYMTAGTTSATTFKVRAGPDTAGQTLTFNGQTGSRVFGGVLASSITITEIVP